MVAPVGHPDRGPERVGAGLGGAGGDRGSAGLGQRLDRRLGRGLPVADAALADRGRDRRPRDGAELARQHLGADRELVLRRGLVAGHPVQPDQERMVVLVERAHRRDPGGVAQRLVEASLRHRAEGGLVQDRLRRGGDPATFREQPGLEAGSTGNLHTREQLRPDVGKLHRVGPAAPGDDSHVDHHVPRPARARPGHPRARRARPGRAAAPRGSSAARGAGRRPRRRAGPPARRGWAPGRRGAGRPARPSSCGCGPCGRCRTRCGSVAGPAGGG